MGRDKKQKSRGGEKMIHAAIVEDEQQAADQLIRCLRRLEEGGEE